MPPLRTAIEVTTGTPSASDSRGTSTVTPRRVAMSNMLSTSTSGRPVLFSSSSRRMVSRRLVESATHSTRSGSGLAGRAAEHDVARDLFVRAAAAQRIGAGQVDQRDLPAHAA